MVIVYLLYSALTAWVVLGDGADLLSEDLLPLLLPQLDHRPRQVRNVAGIAWLGLSLLAFARGWL